MIPTFCFLRCRHINNAQSHSPPSQTNPENCHVQVRATWQSERRRRFLFLTHLWTAEARKKKQKTAALFCFHIRQTTCRGSPEIHGVFLKAFQPRDGSAWKSKVWKRRQKGVFMFWGKCRNSRSELCSVVGLACVCLCVLSVTSHYLQGNSALCSVSCGIMISLFMCWNECSDHYRHHYLIEGKNFTVRHLSVSKDSASRQELT